MAKKHGSQCTVEKRDNLCTSAAHFHRRQNLQAWFFPTSKTLSVREMFLAFCPSSSWKAFISKVFYFEHSYKFSIRSQFIKTIKAIKLVLSSHLRCCLQQRSSSVKKCTVISKKNVLRVRAHCQRLVSLPVSFLHYWLLELNSQPDYHKRGLSQSQCDGLMRIFYWWNGRRNNTKEVMWWPNWSIRRSWVET